MICRRPESSNIDRGGAEVNIGILRSTSYHVKCLKSQNLFCYIISLNKKAAITITTINSWQWIITPASKLGYLATPGRIFISA